MPVVPYSNRKTRRTSRLRIWSVVLSSSAILLTLIILLQTKIAVFYTEPITETPIADLSLQPFPISVNPDNKTITENPLVDDYMHQWVASNHTKPAKDSGFFAMIMYRLASLEWYQNLASPLNRILVIQSGERAEEVAAHFSKILGWNENERTAFQNRIASESPAMPDGKFYPGKYILDSTTSPDAAALAVADRFNAEVRIRYTSELEEQVPLKDALIIASLIEREAYDFTDMRYISGIIWNRLFIDMKLQLDATLQYARATGNTGRWWPVPVPNDKYIDSPYNTYKIAGLPPAPIANPSIDALIAALNPRETDCLFYFHDDNSVFHCTPTYEEHVALLKSMYGQGR